MCKVFGVFSVLSGIVVMTLENPIAMANLLCIAMLAVALLSIFTVATNKANDYAYGSWNPKKVECCKRDIPSAPTKNPDYSFSY
jgi:hypothetical protein